MSNYWTQSIPLILVFAVFYCIAIRPSRVLEGKRYSAVKKLKGGERIVTSHGMYGVVKNVHTLPPASPGLDDQLEFDVEIAPGVAIRLRQEGIKEILKNEADESAETANPTKDGNAQGHDEAST